MIYRPSTRPRLLVSSADPARDCPHGLHHVYLVVGPEGLHSAHHSLHRAQAWVREVYPKAGHLVRAGSTTWDCLDAESGERVTVRKLVVRGIPGWSIEASPGM